MAYDEELAERVRRALQGRTGVVEKKMFGGLAFLISGSMACGVTAADLMIRVGPERYEAALSRPHVRLMDFTGRPLRGLVYIAAKGVQTDASLASWIAEAVEVATSTPTESSPKRTRRVATSSK
jgi:TfoX/Sxy family transcriptional regulator of competence genes